MIHNPATVTIHWCLRDEKVQRLWEGRCRAAILQDAGQLVTLFFSGLVELCCPSRPSSLFYIHAASWPSFLKSWWVLPFLCRWHSVIHAVKPHRSHTFSHLTSLWFGQYERNVSLKLNSKRLTFRVHWAGKSESEILSGMPPEVWFLTRKVNPDLNIQDNWSTQQ